MELHDLLKLSTGDLESPGSILLENQFGTGWGGRSAFFTDPVQIISCYNPEEVGSTLESLDQALKEGLHAAGFISYEAGTALVPHQGPRDCAGFPLIWMGLYDNVQFTDHPVQLPSPPLAEQMEPAPDVTEEVFTRDVEKVLDHIRNGETYQVNYTCRTRFTTSLTAWELYLTLKRAQPVPYAAFINCGEFSVVSQSPELFLEKNGSVLESKPMKGTAPRGSDRAKDRENANWLAGSEKNRAENLMITDLMRNDIGRLSRAGTVEVFDPFRVENYRTVHQMTTGVRGTTGPGTTLSKILKHTFPPGSITGAPKVRTMQIIQELEHSPRKIYTGTVGRFHPNGDLSMNVAIRTVIVNQDGTCEMGIGSGIVADSDPSDEYRETILKASFVNYLNSKAAMEKPDLLETMLLDKHGSLPFLDDHMARLESSSKALDHPFDDHRVRTSLFQWLGEGVPGPAVVRLRLDRRGDTWFELLPFPKAGMDASIKVLLSKAVMNGSDPLLRHKTTARHVYDRELAKARESGFDEALFTNSNGELTEGAITSLFLRTAEGWITPQLSCGLLPGTWRGRFLTETGARPCSITPKIFSRTLEVVMGNAVRGKMEVEEIIDTDGNTIYVSAYVRRP